MNDVRALLMSQRDALLRSANALQGKVDGLNIAISIVASGIETEGHDPGEGHGAKHESPTGEAGTPNHDDPTNNNGGV